MTDVDYISERELIGFINDYCGQCGFYVNGECRIVGPQRANVGEFFSIRLTQLDRPVVKRVNGNVVCLTRVGKISGMPLFVRGEDDKNIARPEPHLCPNCGAILPVLVVTNDKREALFLMGYKTAEQVLRELAGYYPVESLIATLRGN